MRYLLLILLILLFPLNTSFSQSGNQFNLYSDWAKLSLSGKNQEEIEFHFRNSDEKTLIKLKTRIRTSIIENLRRMGIQDIINNSQSIDDLKSVRDKINTEIRFLGLENDKELIMNIKEEFGINVQTL